MIHNPTTHQLPPPRSSFTCHRHHNDTFTGFCPSCLSERLTTASDLRRTKSFSISNTIQQVPVFEPQRKSCDVNTLSSLLVTTSNDTNLNDLEDEIVEMEEKIDQIIDNLKSFSVDLECRKSTFWSTASNKLMKWRKKKSNGVVLTNRLPGGKCHDTQSEIGEYVDSGMGRVSFDKPRASWDGYMVGRSFPRLNVNVAKRSDMEMPVEYIPRDYYLDSSSSNSFGKTLDCRSRFHSIGGENELGRDIGTEFLNKKKSRWWSWKGLGFSKRKGGKGSSQGDDVKLSRSSTSVSWRNTKLNSNENSNDTRIGDEFVLERNASARYSPNHVNEGLLRFYLTPLRLRGSRQRSGTGSGTGKSRLF